MAAPTGTLDNDAFADTVRAYLATLRTCEHYEFGPEPKNELMVCGRTALWISGSTHGCDEHGPARPVMWRERWTPITGADYLRRLLAHFAPAVAPEPQVELALHAVDRQFYCARCGDGFRSTKPPDPQRDTGFGHCTSCHEVVAQTWVAHGFPGVTDLASARARLARFA